MSFYESRSRQMARGLGGLGFTLAEVLVVLDEKAIAHLTPEVMKLLTEHAWPGNIRELEHCIERAVALASGQVLTPEDLAPELRGTIDSALFRGSPTLEEVKRRYLAHVLQETGGNISRAANILGVERRSLQRMLRRYGLRTT